MCAVAAPSIDSPIIQLTQQVLQYCTAADMWIQLYVPMIRVRPKAARSSNTALKFFALHGRPGPVVNTCFTGFPIYQQQR
jgi:hypothetical protein